MRDYLPFTLKGSVSHMDGLLVYVKDGFSYARDVSLENSEYSSLY